MRLPLRDYTMFTCGFKDVWRTAGRILFLNYQAGVFPTDHLLKTRDLFEDILENEILDLVHSKSKTKLQCFGDLKMSNPSIFGTQYLGVKHDIYLHEQDMSLHGSLRRSGWGSIKCLLKIVAKFSRTGATRGHIRWAMDRPRRCRLTLLDWELGEWLESCFYWISYASIDVVLLVRFIC